MSVQDVIKKSVLESDMFNQAITLSTVVTIIVNLAVAVVMGVLIYYIYKKFYDGVVYSRNFAITLMGMTVLTCMVTLAISTNIVISLGMVGALSIVRYRTAIKEPLDLMYMFWAITTGITVGASMYLLAVIAAAIVIAILYIMQTKGDRCQSYLYVIHYDKTEAYDEIIRSIGKARYMVRSRIMRGDESELTIEVHPSKNQNDFVERINKIEGVKDVTALQYNGEYHG